MQVYTREPGKTFDRKVLIDRFLSLQEFVTGDNELVKSLLPVLICVIFLFSFSPRNSFDVTGTLYIPRNQVLKSIILSSSQEIGI